MSDHHVFISYKRGGATEAWMDHHFRAPLQRYLHDALAEKARVFVDKTSIPAGARWRERIGVAAARTPIMIALLSRHYFQSPWCVAELETARRRQAALVALGCDVEVLIPIQLQDGEKNPSTLVEQVHDWRQWFISEPSFAVSPRYIDLSAAIRDLCDDVATRIDRLAAYGHPDVALPDPPDDASPTLTSPLPRILP